MQGQSEGIFTQLGTNNVPRARGGGGRRSNNIHLISSDSLFLEAVQSRFKNFVGLGLSWVFLRYSNTSTTMANN